MKGAGEERTTEKKTAMIKGLYEEGSTFEMKDAGEERTTEKKTAMIKGYVQGGEHI